MALRWLDAALAIFGHYCRRGWLNRVAGMMRFADVDWAAQSRVTAFVIDDGQQPTQTGY